MNTGDFSNYKTAKVKRQLNIACPRFRKGTDLYDYLEKGHVVNAVALQ